MKSRKITFRGKNPESINGLPVKRIVKIAQEGQNVFPDWASSAGTSYNTLTFRTYTTFTVDALREQCTEKDGKIESLRAEN